MKKPLSYILIIGLLFLAGCTGNQQTETTTSTILEATTTTEPTTTTTTPTTSTTTTTTSTTTTTIQAPPKTVIINITATSFKPVDTRINQGDIVVWINTDKGPHTVTSEYEPIELDSRGIERGANYTHTFDAVGIYSYQCDLHPKLKGRVVVVEKDADKPAAQTPINNSPLPAKPNKPVAY